jgi:hypothetical protein
MGVKTKVFGPPAWRFFEFIASVTDRIMDEARQAQDIPRLTEAQRLFRVFLHLTVHVIPCIYCRLSYTEFINDRIQQDRYMSLEHGAKRAIYDLHNMVNEKLFWQKIKENEKSQGQWWEKNPSSTQTFTPPLTFDEALKTRFRTCSYQDIMDWFGYVALDYEARRWPFVRLYLQAVCDILNQLPKPWSVTQHIQRELAKRRAIWDDPVLVADLELRLRLIYNLDVVDPIERPLFVPWYTKIQAGAAGNCG